MAGDWMKIELELPDKPEVHSMAGMLGIDPDAVVGKLVRVWQWFDKHTTDGNAHGVSFALVDRVTSVSGFGEAMSFVGWLEQHDKTLVMPRFDRHTSKSAKTRALGAKRVANFNAKANADTNANTNANTNGASVSEALPREEKRRDKEHMSGNPDVVPEKPKKQTRTAEAKEVLAYLNQVCGSRFQPVAANLNLITARLNEGATVDDVKAVIDRKHTEWCNDAAMRKYLRPETLFNAIKFAGYLGTAGLLVVQPVKTDPAEAQRSKEWAQFEYAVRSFRETVWPAGMESDRLRRAAEIQAIADSFGVTFERPLLEEVAA